MITTHYVLIHAIIPPAASLINLNTRLEHSPNCVLQLKVTQVNTIETIGKPTAL